ncbi:uncharacterized protein LOC110419753 [Herrania umbratica]|uniref:Uncharacterized protein LOC110419753 n=1 Tax=Herrania umbratica TaxID=108875 RepID=A0A6J1APR1_9ROSI|nr:uncharacterized protein LOC110419753 [Herrania umbratica]
MQTRVLLENQSDPSIKRAGPLGSLAYHYQPANSHSILSQFQVISKFQVQTPTPKREVQEMDPTGNQKQQSLSQFMKSQFHRKLTQLVLSVSVFSLFFSHSYWLSLLHSFNFNFHNTLPFQLFSHAIDKNCIFLLCNGLLVFLAKYSGLISSSSKHNLTDDQSFKSYEDVPQSESIVLEPKAPLLEKEVALGSSDEALENGILMEGRQEEEEEAAAAEREIGNFTLEEEEEHGEKWDLMTTAEQEGNAAFVQEAEVEGSEVDFFVQEFGEDENPEREEEVVELVEGNRVLSTEELNKRFDEFIRKMKEELRIEARQQLVMV